MTPDELRELMLDSPHHEDSNSSEDIRTIPQEHTADVIILLVMLGAYRLTDRGYSNNARPIKGSDSRIYGTDELDWLVWVDDELTTIYVRDVLVFFEDKGV